MVPLLVHAEPLWHQRHSSDPENQRYSPKRGARRKKQSKSWDRTRTRYISCRQWTDSRSITTFPALRSIPSATVSSRAEPGKPGELGAGSWELGTGDWGLGVRIEEDQKVGRGQGSLSSAPSHSSSISASQKSAVTSPRPSLVFFPPPLFHLASSPPSPFSRLFAHPHPGAFSSRIRNCSHSPPPLSPKARVSG